MSLEDWKLCRGCTMYDPPYSCKDGADPIFNERRCPCIGCIVKVTCKKPCETLGKYLFDTKQIKMGRWKTKNDTM